MSVPLDRNRRSVFPKSPDGLSQNDDIANLLDPSDVFDGLSIFPGEVSFEKKEVRHLEYEVVRGIYILPTAAGEFEIKVSILCNEMARPEEQVIKVVVE